MNTVFRTLPSDVIHIIDNYSLYTLCCGEFTHDIKVRGNFRDMNGYVNYGFLSQLSIYEHVIVEIIKEEVLVYFDGLLTSRFIAQGPETYGKPQLFQNEIYILKCNGEIDVYDTTGVLKRQIQFKNYTNYRFEFLITMDGHFICSPRNYKGEIATLIFIFTNGGDFVKVIRTEQKKPRLLHTSHETGNFYVASGWHVNEYDSTGEFICQIKFPQQVKSLCTTGFAGEFVVNIFPKYSVDVYNPNGKFVRQICLLNSASVSVIDLFVTGTGRLFVSLPFDHKVRCFK